MQVPRFLRICLVGILALVLGAGVFGPAPSARAAAGITLSRNFAGPGDTVTVKGVGFHAGDDIVVSADVQVAGKPRHIQSSGTADQNGAFSVDLGIPGGTNQNTYTVTAKDFHGGNASHWLAILPLAFITAGGNQPTVWVIPRHSLYVSGKGFQAGETITIAVTLPLYDGNSVNVSKQATADKNGNFHETVVKIPNNAKAGNVTMTATGGTSKKTGKATLHVFYRPTITLGSRTVRPGTTVVVKGREFVPNTRVNVALTIPRTGATNITLSRAVLADDNGNFQTGLDLPSNTQVGHYNVSAVDTTGGFKDTTVVTVSVNPSIDVKPTTIYPGQAFTASGENFGAGVTVTVRATFSIGNGKTQVVEKSTQTGGGGNYSVTLNAPGNAAPSKVNVVASSSNAHVTGAVQVRARPTAVPPTATSTPKPTPKAGPTWTPIPTNTPLPKKHKPAFRFQYISVWWHVVRVGTYEHIVVQSHLRTTLGVWVHVYFPSGQRLDFYKNTDRHGKWEVQFNIPSNARTRTNGRAVITFRLWHGTKSIKDYRAFSLVY